LFTKELATLVMEALIAGLIPNLSTSVAGVISTLTSMAWE